jgi:hypothetical protein
VTENRDRDPIQLNWIGALERDELWFDRHPALAFCLSMIFSENRIPPVGSKPEGKLFRIML